jgi:hypothetical protein
VETEWGQAIFELPNGLNPWALIGQSLQSIMGATLRRRSKLLIWLVFFTRISVVEHWSDLNPEGPKGATNSGECPYDLTRSKQTFF